MAGAIFALIQGPGDQPRHPVNVLGRMHQRHACAGWPVWAARKDCPRVNDWADLGVFDAAFHLVMMELEVAWRPVAQGLLDQPDLLAQWRRAMVKVARNMRTLRRMALKAMEHHELRGWDGPRRPPPREQSRLICEAIAAYEAQERGSTGSSAS